MASKYPAVEVIRDGAKWSVWQAGIKLATCDSAMVAQIISEQLNHWFRGDDRA